MPLPDRRLFANAVRGRACDVLQIDRSTVRYQSQRGDDADLRDTIKRISRERRRFGYRRIHVMVAREGFAVNHKKVRRIYVEEKLHVRRRGGRKRALGTRKPMVLPDAPNQRPLSVIASNHLSVKGIAGFRLGRTD
jgi:putative transposase